jgi:hypothetical protein
MPNQSRRQQAVRDITGTELDYNSDFLALFALSGFTTGTFNERFLLWLNSQMGTDYGDPNATSKGGLPGAMHAYAVSLGYNDWNSLDTIEGFLLDAPVLDWDDETADNTPDFTISFPIGIAEDDVIRLQYDDNSNFTSPTEVTNTLDAAEIIANEITEALAALPNGTYYVRVRVERDSNPISPWSNTETVPIAAAVPVLSNATGTATSDTEADLEVDTDIDEGDLYWVVTLSATPPSAAQIKAGLNHLGAAAADSGTQAISGAGTQTVTGGATGLTAATTYYAHFVQEDDVGNNSNVASSASFETDSDVWTPADLGADLMLWLEADDLTTMFQTITGTTAVASDGDVVGTWNDKSGDGFHLTATANDTTRPTYKTDGGAGNNKSYVNFDGTNDALRRAASLGIYAAGAVSIFAAMRGDPGGAGRQLVSERSSSSANPAYAWWSETDADDFGIFIRNDANTATDPNNAFADEVLDGTDRVLGFTDSGSAIIHYSNGTQVDSDAYTRSGTVTVDRFGLGASFRASASDWFAARVYALVIVNRVLTAEERADLVTYLGNKMGIAL